MSQSKIFQREVLAVQQLGEAIGYGNMMEIASALWRLHLIDGGGPASGACIPMSLYTIKPEHKGLAEKEIARYDKLVKQALETKP